MNGWLFADISRLYLVIIFMIKGYKQVEVIDNPSENCSIIKVTKDGKTFLMHEFDSVDDSD